MRKLTISEGCHAEIERALRASLPVDEIDAYLMPDGSLDMDRVTLCIEAPDREVERKTTLPLESAPRSPFKDYAPGEPDEHD